MFGFTRRRKWPELPFDEIKKRAQVLVIDDEDFSEETQEDGESLTA